MLYTMREGHDGIQFYPIRDYNVYIYCKQCKRFVQVPEPAGYIAEVGAIGASIESLDLCDEWHRNKQRSGGGVLYWT